MAHIQPEDVDALFNQLRQRFERATCWAKGG